MDQPSRQRRDIGEPAGAARDYPDPVSRELARDLIGAQSVRFDASDSMPQVMESAFNNAVLEYLDSPRQLNVILQSLHQVRKAAYQAGASR